MGKITSICNDITEVICRGKVINDGRKSFCKEIAYVCYDEENISYEVPVKKVECIEEIKNYHNGVESSLSKESIEALDWLTKPKMKNPATKEEFTNWIKVKNAKSKYEIDCQREVVLDDFSEKEIDYNMEKYYNLG